MKPMSPAPSTPMFTSTFGPRMCPIETIIKFRPVPILLQQNRKVSCFKRSNPNSNDPFSETNNENGFAVENIHKGYMTTLRLFQLI